MSYRLEFLSPSITAKCLSIYLRKYEFEEHYKKLLSSIDLNQEIGIVQVFTGGWIRYNTGELLQ
jgi:hypothetical protein